MKNILRLLIIFLVESQILTSCSQYKVKHVNSLIYYAIADGCEGMGIIDGLTRQNPLVGDYTTEVTAVASNGFVFVKWNDGNINASRSDLSTDVVFRTYIAYFEVANDQ